MKIGLVCPYNMFRAGGVQESVKALSRQFMAAGHQVKIISPLPRGKLKQILPDNYILLGRSIDIKSLSTTPSISIAADNEQIDAILAAEKFDILHFHEPWVPVLSRQILQRSSSVNIATVHAKLPESLSAKSLIGAVRPYLNSIVKQFDGFTAVSSVAAEYLLKVSPDTKVEIIANGVNLNVYRTTLETTRAAGAILYIGRLEKRKGLKHLIKSFALLAEKNAKYRLIIAGEGAYRIKLKQLVDDLELTSKVSFRGYINEQEKLQLLQTSRILASPALYGESFGIILLEAMASGLPVVAGNNPGYQVVLSGRGSLSLINPKDHLEFANRLELMMTDSELRNLWRRWAKRQLANYDYHFIAKQYLKLYYDLLNKRDKRAA